LLCFVEITKREDIMQKYDPIHYFDTGGNTYGDMVADEHGDYYLVDDVEPINEVDGVLAEIQCMESCLAQGFTLNDYIESQKLLVEILNKLKT
jgi:hypothetical protein